MNERTVRICPFENCGWEYAEPPIEPVLDRSIKDQLDDHTAKVEDALRSHLDGAHSGWTMADVERASLEQKTRLVFNASPFSPTTARYVERFGSRFPR